MEPGHVGVAEGGVGRQPLVRVELEQGLDQVDRVLPGRIPQALGQGPTFHGGGLLEDGLRVVRADLLEIKKN